MTPERLGSMTNPLPMMLGSDNTARYVIQPDEALQTENEQLRAKLAVARGALEYYGMTSRLWWYDADPQRVAREALARLDAE